MTIPSWDRISRDRLLLRGLVCVASRDVRSESVILSKVVDPAVGLVGEHERVTLERALARDGILAHDQPRTAG